MAEETIYLCNFRVSVDGDWLCLKELTDVQLQEVASLQSPDDGGLSSNSLIATVASGGRYTPDKSELLVQWDRYNVHVLAASAIIISKTPVIADNNVFGTCCCCVHNDRAMHI